MAGVQRLLEVAQEVRLRKGPRVVLGENGGWAKKTEEERPGRQWKPQEGSCGPAGHAVCREARPEKARGPWWVAGEAHRGVDSEGAADGWRRQLRPTH